MKMIARKEMRYGGCDMVPGDTFEVRTSRDARVLKAIRKADYAPEENAPQSDPQTEPEPEPGPKKGRYARRDMRAED